MEKPNPEILQKLEAQLKWLKIEISHAVVLAKHKDHELWKEVQKIVKEKLEQVENKLDSHETMTADQRIIFLETRRQFRFFYDLVDNAVDNLVEFQELQEKTKKKAAEYRERLKSGK